LTGPLGIPTNVAPEAEVVAVPERDTVSQVTIAPARLEAVVASLTTATKEKVGSAHVDTLVKEPPSEQVIEKNVFPSNTPPSVVPSSQVYVTTSPNVTSVIRSTVAFSTLGGTPQLTG
jgi:hypothetical protein